MFKITASQIAANNAFWRGDIAPTKPKAPARSAPKPRRVPQSRFVHYTGLLSKTTPKMSDEEFLNAAKEQAQKDFGNGVFQGYEFWELQNAYVSVVSPDRVTLARNVYKQHQTRQAEPYHGTRHLADSLAPAPRPGPEGEIFAYDAENRPVAKYVHGQGWTEIYTPEENERKRMILRAYNDTWTALHRQVQNENNKFDMIQSDLGVGAYDAQG